MRGQPGAKSWLKTLAGKRLRCHCEAGVPCHADVLVELFGELVAAKGITADPAADTATSDEDEDGYTRPKLGARLWGRGPPLLVRRGGKVGPIP